ncbi:MAG: M4 family metallopeptidase, partial [Anaerolineae bacterium]
MRRFAGTLLALCLVLGTVLTVGPAPQRVRALPASQVAAPLCGGEITADADASVLENDPTANFWDSSSLMVARGGRTGLAETLLHFDSAAALVPEGSALLSAEIEFAMAPVTGSNPFTIGVAGLSDVWSERLVTWNDRPAPVGDFGTRAYTYETGGDLSLVRIDVTPLVNLWLTGAVTETSVLLRPGDTPTDASFRSLQSEPGLAPRLVLRCRRAAEPARASSAPLDTRQAAGLDRLAAHSALPLRLQLQAGAVGFAGLDLALPPEAGTSGTERARWFTRAYSDTLRLRDPAMQLQMTRSSANGEHVFYRQRYQGIPVYGSELGVHLMAGRVVAVTGSYLPEITADPTPALTAEQAEALVLGLKGGEVGDATPTQLRYVNTGLNGGPDKETHLTWQVVLKNAGTYFVDATTGEIRLEIPAALSMDFDIETGNHASPSTWCGEWWFTNADDHLCSEDGCNAEGWADNEAPHTGWYINQTYWWYRTNLGLWSYDGADSEIQVYIHVGNPWANAHYLISGECIEFGDGWAQVGDVLTHEYTHGVVEHLSNLVYSNESGALNESFADVFGELVQGGESNWIHGEGLPGFECPGDGYGRSLSYPPACGQPEEYVGWGWHPLAGSPNEDNDQGGVHTNSGVPNKAAYLLINGGTMKGYTVAGVGPVKGRALLFAGMVGLPASATFMQMRNMMVHYANLWGWTTQEVCSARNAYAAVGVGEGDYDCDGVENTVDGDMDGDYVPNGTDNCPSAKNVGQSDVNGNGAGDACDNDDDGDGELDVLDNCPLAWNPGQENLVHPSDPLGDACEDWDDDGT